MYVLNGMLSLRDMGGRRRLKDREIFHLSTICPKEERTDQDAAAMTVEVFLVAQLERASNAEAHLRLCAPK